LDALEKEMVGPFDLSFHGLNVFRPDPVLPPGESSIPDVADELPEGRTAKNKFSDRNRVLPEIDPDRYGSLFRKSDKE
jgi:hypothetical protein